MTEPTISLGTEHIYWQHGSLWRRKEEWKSGPVAGFTTKTYSWSEYWPFTASDWLLLGESHVHATTAVVLVHAPAMSRRGRQR